jgi:hypothetical protein
MADDPPENDLTMNRKNIKVIYHHDGHFGNKQMVTDGRGRCPQARFSGVPHKFPPGRADDSLCGRYMVKSGKTDTII